MTFPRDGSSYIILSPIELSIRRKIEAVGKPLKEWDVQINYGIKTGCNEAFIITTEKRNELLYQCQSEEERQRTAELIRPILRGRDIKRYSYDWAGLWIINTHNGIKEEGIPPINIQEYPVLKAHLDQYREKLQARADKGDTPYNLRNCAYIKDFEQPKIVWKRIGSILRFSYDIQGCLGLDSTCIMSGEHIEYLCCILNSIMGHYLLKDSPKTGTGDLLVSVQAIDPIRVPYKCEHEEKLSNLLKLQVTCHNEDVEEEINRIVFSIFDLSTEEQEYIKLNQEAP